MLFWSVVDLTRKLDEFRDYYNEYRVHRSLAGTTPGATRRSTTPCSNCARSPRVATALSWLVLDADCGLSTKFATHTLGDPGFAAFTKNHIKNSQLPEASFIFEIVSEAAILCAKELRMLQANLKPAGCRFTLAGFDGREASFNFIKDFAPDFVKLAYNVVKDIDRTLAASERVESINRQCHSQGIKTIAEYVESREVPEQLRLIEVDFAQGLGVSPPQPLP